MRNVFAGEHMTKRLHIIHKVNEKGFTVVINEDDFDGATLGGANLNFPVVHVVAKGIPLDFEISWDLAERLANGTASRVVY